MAATAAKQSCPHSFFWTLSSNRNKHLGVCMPTVKNFYNSTALRHDRRFQNMCCRTNMLNSLCNAGFARV
ncbi:hypothetical protein OHAE_3088 [Ochrobactrum soli]|uniref:Uncharacterized protein n=1 Tax=Ochrobactrum soli TaxID=2448455 RepID=A0A2P9HGF5_9HYPH|nr:hypothetical protein OHAE_3088 [[Ochrobactrum] soli]